MRRKPCLLLLVLTLILVACGGSRDEGVLPSMTAAVTSTTASEIPSTTEGASPTGMSSVLVVDDAAAGAVVVADDGLPFLVVDAGGSVRTVKCLDETCTELEFEASFSSRRGISFISGAPSLVVSRDGFPVFVYEDLDTEEGETARFEERLPPDNRMHLVQCLDARCVEFTDTDLGTGATHSLEILGDGAPLISYGSYGESWDDLRDWRRAMVIGCDDAACTERVETWIGALQGAGTQVLIGSDGLPVVAYGLEDEIGAVFCDDADCVSHERVTVATDNAGTALVGATVGEEGPVFAYTAGPQLKLVACLEDRCSEVGPEMPVGPEMTYGSAQVVWRSDLTPVFAFSDENGFELDVATCSDADCGEVSVVRVAEDFSEFDLSMDTDDNPVVLLDGVLIRCVDPECRLGGEPSSLWDTSGQLDRVLPPVMEGWHLAGVLGDRGGGSLDVVIEGGPGLVAFGQDCGLDADGVPGCEAEVWVSSDGQNWEEAGILGNAEVWEAAVNGSTILAGGGRTFTEGGVDTAAPALWLSTDGRHWTLVSTDDDLFHGCTPSDPEWCVGNVDAIVPVDDGFWVMGSNASGPVAWFSDDGASWKASGYPLEAFDESELMAGVWMNWAVAGGDGIVANGETCETAPIHAGLLILTDATTQRPVCDLLAATSVDGSTWRPLDDPFRSAGDLDLWEPKTWSGGYVAAGQLCDLQDECILSIATSEDAVNWKVEPIEGPAIYVETLYGFGDGVIGIGIHDPVFIHSNDMTTWTMESADPELFPSDRHAINDAIEYGGRFVAVGMTADGPTVWWYDE